MDVEDLIKTIIAAAIEVKRTLGSGFLENVYLNALVHELRLRDIPVETEKRLRIYYKGTDVGWYRADIIVDGRIILELKSTESIAIAHEYQLVNYLRATGIDNGLIINFGSSPIGIKRKYRMKA
ncbi:MAG: GxxExxY protein [Muribaculum sp.]|nr:GxxExxY protein [Muribaculum sp.]